MKPKIKTADNYWRYRVYILGSALLIFFFLFIAYAIILQSEKEELENQIKETKEEAIQIGQNSTVNYIIGNEKYPTKFKGNIVWLTKNHLCEDN